MFFLRSFWALEKKFISLWSKFKTIPRLEHLKEEKKKKHNIQILSKRRTCLWLSCKLVETRRVWRHQRGVSLFLHHLLSPLSFLSIHRRWVESIICCEDTAHDTRVKAGKSGRYITWNEWTTPLWPGQGRKTHVLLVLAGWLPAERVGNSSSGRDGKRWKRRRRKGVLLHVSSVPWH